MKRDLTSSAILVVLTTTISLGCDKRTPEEKGRDYAKEKVGFVEGAADELAKRSKGIGEDLGKGVGELVKGTGSAVKDVAHPTVKVELGQALKDSGLSIGQANEGADGNNGRDVVVHLRAQREFSGELWLEGVGADNSRVRTLGGEKVLLPSDGTTVLHFYFDSSVRLSKLDHFELQKGTAHTIALSDAAKESGIVLSQLSEKTTDKGLEVSVYALFTKPSQGALSLRAYDATHGEVGRSTELKAEKRAADSAGFVTFTLDARTPLSSVKSYEIFVK